MSLFRSVITWSTAVVSALLVGGIAYVALPSSQAKGAPSGVLPPPLEMAAQEGASAFDHVASITNLDAGLLRALQRATNDAAADGVTLVVNSGWRSVTYQQQLLDAAIRKYGSREAAARWVAPPDKSEHVSGHAVDIGPSKAAVWLAQHGVSYDLCRTYANEPWHFELRRGAATRGCPRPYADAAHDPRLA